MQAEDRSTSRRWYLLVVSEGDTSTLWWYHEADAVATGLLDRRVRWISCAANNANPCEPKKYDAKDDASH